MRFPAVKSYRWALAILLLGALLTSPGRAVAEPLDAWVSGTCAPVSLNVLQWKPALGPPAAFVADAFAKYGEIWIGLGADATGYWSAETTWFESDDHDNTALKLVHTTYTGKRRSLFVAGFSDRALVKQRLFVLAKKEWPIETLSHDETLELPKHVPGTQMQTWPTWWVQITQKNRTPLRFDVSVQGGCWCEYTWSAWPLATKAKGK